MSMQDLVKSLGTLSKAQALDTTTQAAAAPATAPATTTTTTTTTESAAAGAGAPETAPAAAAPAAAAPAAADPAKVVVVGAGAATDAIMKALAAAEGDGMAKSFTMELEGGEQVQAFDGVELMKSLAAVVDANEKVAVEAMGMAVMTISAQSGQIAELTKSLTAASELINTQGETMAAMRADLDNVRNQPTGRRSIASPVQASAEMAKSMTPEQAKAQEMPTGEFLAKCLSLQKDGSMTLQEVAMAEAAIGSGVAVPDSIRNKVFKQ